MLWISARAANEIWAAVEGPWNAQHASAHGMAADFNVNAIRGQPGEAAIRPVNRGWTQPDGPVSHARTAYRTLTKIVVSAE